MNSIRNMATLTEGGSIDTKYEQNHSHKIEQCME